MSERAERRAKAKKRTTGMTVTLSEAELLLLTGALGLYQQAMEKAAHLAYGFTTERQRGRMINRGIDAIELRNRLFKGLSR